MKKYLLSALLVVFVSGITLASANGKRPPMKKHYAHHTHHKHHHHHHPHHK
ncbi:MAG TPA: hypothetical protein VMH01_12550 [Puia sp.]|nr:hypothetical protein [Puia sp.]